MHSKLRKTRLLEQTRRSTGGGKLIHLSGRHLPRQGLAQEIPGSPESQNGPRPRIRRRTYESTSEMDAAKRVGADDAEVRSEAAGRGVRKAHGSAKSSAGRGVVVNEYLLQAKALDARQNAESRQDAER